MSWGENSRKKLRQSERKITVKLSDADCDRLARKCGKYGLTIGELIENFVGDLVGGTYSMEVMKEIMLTSGSSVELLVWNVPRAYTAESLIEFGVQTRALSGYAENVETIKSDIEITKQNIAEPSDEWKDIVYHKYNDDLQAMSVPCYNSVDEYIASEKKI